MTPSLKKEKLVKINKDHFQKALKDSAITQKEIAENILYTSDAYFCRKLSQGIISKDWLYKLADCLNVSREYLTGESDDYITRLAERRNEITANNQRKPLNEFMISRGFNDGLCDDLTEDDLDNIEMFISMTAKSHENIISNMISNQQDMLAEMKKLQKQIKAIKGNNSSK